MQIGPHMVRTMLCTTSSTQVPKASAESRDANLRPATQGSRAEPRSPQSAESQEEDSTWNPGWRVSCALAPFHCCTYASATSRSSEPHSLASCPPLGSNRDIPLRGNTIYRCQSFTKDKKQSCEGMACIFLNLFFTWRIIALQ